MRSREWFNQLVYRRCSGEGYRALGLGSAKGERLTSLRGNRLYRDNSLRLFVFSVRIPMRSDIDIATPSRPLSNRCYF